MTAAFAHRPAVLFPDHVLTLEGMLDLSETHYSASPDFARIQRMIGNTKIDTRRFAMPIEALGEQTGLAQRAQLYMERALPMAEEVARQALEHAALSAADIDHVITLSSTSFIMPSLDAYLMNSLGLRPEIRRTPIAQLGCVAGVSALRAAYDHCRAYPAARVLIVAVEMSSLCFFPERKDLTSAVCASIFGDGAAACVVTGADVEAPAGLRLDDALSYTMPSSEHYIRYEILDGGYHLTLDKGVMYSIPKVAPKLEAFLNANGTTGPELDFVHAHTGGRRIIDLLARHLKFEADRVRHTRASLREVGNTASVSIFDVIHRAWVEESPSLSEVPNRGLIVAFGPGFTMEALAASWSPGRRQGSAI